MRPGLTLPTALISNGYNFVDFISELRQLPNTKILISLEAASEKHDAIRRKPGAFARIAEGVRRPPAIPICASVLQSPPS